MKLYITVYDEGFPKKSVTFTGTQADQKKLEKVIRDNGDEVIHSGPIEVPTDKDGLIKWLNTYEVTGISTE